MATVRKQYNKEFKQETVRLIVEKGVPVAQVSRDMGISANVLYRWKQEALAHGQKAFPGHGQPIEEELVQLRRELEVVKRERDILKKATAFFAKYQAED
jgi:transposase